MNVRTKGATIFCVIAGLVAFGIGLSAEDSAKELAALQAVDQTWLKAYDAGDLDALASLYDEHAVLLLPGASREWSSGDSRVLCEGHCGIEEGRLHDQSRLHPGRGRFR